MYLPSTPMDPNNPKDSSQSVLSSIDLLVNRHLLIQHALCGNVHLKSYYKLLRIYHCMWLQYILFRSDSLLAPDSSTNSHLAAMESRFSIDQPVAETFKCLTCGRELTTLWNLTRHIKEVHEQEHRYSCPVSGCGYPTYDFSTMRRHVERLHPTMEATKGMCMSPSAEENYLSGSATTAANATSSSLVGYLTGSVASPTTSAAYAPTGPPANPTSTAGYLMNPVTNWAASPIDLTADSITGSYPTSSGLAAYPTSTEDSLMNSVTNATAYPFNFTANLTTESYPTSSAAHWSSTNMWDSVTFDTTSAAITYSAITPAASNPAVMTPSSSTIAPASSAIASASSAVAPARPAAGNAKRPRYCTYRAKGMSSNHARLQHEEEVHRSRYNAAYFCQEVGCPRGEEPYRRYEYLILHMGSKHVGRPIPPKEEARQIPANAETSLQQTITDLQTKLEEKEARAE